MNNLLDSLLKENKNNTKVIYNYLNILFFKLEFIHSNSENKKSIFEQFVILIQENINENYCAGTYAELLKIPLKELIKVVKQETNKTPCNIITELVIENAKKLLLNTNHSSKMIAYQLGFQEPYYFINYFKKNVGLTPTQFRKQH